MNGLVIFDIDGTICDTNGVDDRCYTTAVLSCLGVSPRQIDWSGAPDINDQAILEWLSRKHLARDLSIEEIGEVVRHFVNLLQVESTRNSSAFRPVRGAVEIIERVTRAGWNVAFATGGWRASAELKLQLIGIAPKEYVLVTASEATTRQDIVRLAISLRRSAALPVISAHCQRGRRNMGRDDGSCARVTLRWNWTGTTF